MEITKDKIEGFQALVNVVMEFGTKFAEVMSKNNITVEDVDKLREAIKQDPTEYFPGLKK